jgi:hypothetical protein
LPRYRSRIAPSSSGFSPGCWSTTSNRDTGGVPVQHGTLNRAAWHRDRVRRFPSCSCRCAGARPSQPRGLRTRWAGDRRARGPGLATTCMTPTSRRWSSPGSLRRTSSPPDPALFVRLGKLAVSGVLTPRIERTYTLTRSRTTSATSQAAKPAASRDDRAAGMTWLRT